VNRIRKAWWLPAAASAGLAIALYAVSLGGTYVYDDFEVLFNDARLRDSSQWKLYWTQSYNGGVDNLYRPLVSMSYAIQWWLHGDRVWAFHLINILLHAGVCALVAEFTRRLLITCPSARAIAGAADPGSASTTPSTECRQDRSTRGALLAGLLFAALPIHVEAVANIVGRAELMCAAGAMGALVLFLHRPMTTARAFAITACFVLSLLSKEQGMLLPLLLLVLALCLRLRPQIRVVSAIAIESAPELDNQPADIARRDETQRRAWLALILMLCWGLAGYIVLRESILKFWWDRIFLDSTIQPMVLSRGVDRWLLPVSLIGRYAALLIFPVKLSPDYGGMVIGSAIRFDDPYFWIGVIAILAWLGFAVLAIFRRNGVMLFCLLALAITYGVVGNIVTLIGTNFGERLMYLPSVFFVILIAVGLQELPRISFAAIGTIILIATSLKTFSYARRWNDRLSFYQTALEEQPRSIRLYMLTASELMSQKRLDEAADVVARGRELMPDYHEIWIQSGVIALEAGKLDDADAYLDHALQLKPGFKAGAWKDKVAQRRRELQAPK